MIRQNPYNAFSDFPDNFMRKYIYLTIFAALLFCLSIGKSATAKSVVRIDDDLSIVFDDPFWNWLIITSDRYLTAGISNFKLLMKNSNG